MEYRPSRKPYCRNGKARTPATPRPSLNGHTAQGGTQPMHCRQPAQPRRAGLISPNHEDVFALALLERKELLD